MTTTTFGSDASTIKVRVLSAEDSAAEFGTDLYVDDALNTPTLVLADGGNCLAYFIDGAPDSWRDLANRIISAADNWEARS